MYQDARLGRFDVLLVWALDRFSREGVAATLEIIQRLGRHQVRVLSLQESWTEVEGPMQELLFSIVAWVAKMESNRRSERTKAGRFGLISLPGRVVRHGNQLLLQAAAGHPAFSLMLQSRRRMLAWAHAAPS